MNYSVHTVMYAYFCLMSVSRTRPLVAGVAPLITSLQITQVVWAEVNSSHFESY
jgi:hypothetical protein